MKLLNLFFSICGLCLTLTYIQTNTPRSERCSAKQLSNERTNGRKYGRTDGQIKVNRGCLMTQNSIIYFFSSTLLWYLYVWCKYIHIYFCVCMYKCQIRAMNMTLILFSFLLLKLSSFFWTILPSFHPCFGLQCVIVRVRERAGYSRISGGGGSDARVGVGGFGNLFQERLICIYDNILGKGF